MAFKFNIKREIKLGLALLLLFALIGFSERKQTFVAVNEVVIKIENIEGNHFIDEKDITRLMQLSFENLKGASLKNLNLKELEDRIKRDRFIKEAELYADLKGNLIVRAVLRRPIARLVRSDGPDAYISEDGTVMPALDKFSARVVLISGSFSRRLIHEENILNVEGGTELMDLLQVIREDKFWKAQIAQIDIDAKGKASIYPQVGDELIEFGKLGNTHEKLKKLRVYYKEILPEMGWNKYSRVNLEFEGQIVAE